MKESFRIPMSFISIENYDIIISVPKCPEYMNENAIIVRVYEVSGKKANALLKTAGPVKSASYVDINENCLECGLKIRHEGHNVDFEVDVYSVATVFIEF
jgi:alpha-mannosidase